MLVYIYFFFLYEVGTTFSLGRNARCTTYPILRCICGEGFTVQLTPRNEVSASRLGSPSARDGEILRAPGTASVFPVLHPECTFDTLWPPSDAL